MLRSQEIIPDQNSANEKNAMVGRQSLERKLKELCDKQNRSANKTSYFEALDRPILKYHTSVGQPPIESKITSESRFVPRKKGTRSHVETLSESAVATTNLPSSVYSAKQFVVSNSLQNTSRRKLSSKYNDTSAIEWPSRDQVVPVTHLHYNPFSALSVSESFGEDHIAAFPSRRFKNFEAVHTSHNMNEAPTTINRNATHQLAGDTATKKFPYSPHNHYTSSVSKQLSYQTWSHTLISALPGSRPGSSKYGSASATAATNTNESYLQKTHLPLKHTSSSPGIMSEAARIQPTDDEPNLSACFRRMSNGDILPLANINDLNSTSANSLAVTNSKPRSKPLVTTDRSTFTSKSIKVSQNNLSKLNTGSRKGKIKPNLIYHGISPRQYSTSSIHHIPGGGHVSSIPNQNSRLVLDDSFTVLNSPNNAPHRNTTQYGRAQSRAHSAKYSKAGRISPREQSTPKLQNQPKLPTGKKFRINGSARSRQAKSQSNFGADKPGNQHIPRILLHSGRKKAKSSVTSTLGKTTPPCKNNLSPSSLSPDTIQTSGSRKSSNDSGRGTMASNFARSCGDGSDATTKEQLPYSEFSDSNLEYLLQSRDPGDGEDDPAEDSTTNINDFDYEEENDSEVVDEDPGENEFAEEYVDAGSICMDTESDMGTVEYCQDDDSDCVDDNAVASLDEDCSDDADGLSEGASECSLSTTASQSGGDLRPCGTGIVKPAVIRSLFHNCPPVINFATKHEQVEPLPQEIRKLLKWKVSSITPIVVRHTVTRSGFKASKKSYDWLGYFGKHMKSNGFRSLREYQKMNHFPGSFQLGRKDRLWRNISRMQTRFGKKEFGFVPQSFVLPWDKKLLKNAWDEGGTKQKYIIKPPASARGIGIKVIHKWNQIPMKRPILVQKYLSRPYLINGSKFDLRLYVQVTSFDPLRIYLFDDGLVRFATCKYSSSMKHLSNRYMHLTNYSINKKSGDFQQNDDASLRQGHKWSLKALWEYFRENRINPDKIWEQMKDIVIKTIISVEQFTNSLVKSNCRRRYCCHELFGFDIMLDDKLRPWVLEVNISPSLHSNSSLDVEIKGPMVKDMFNLAGFHLPDKKQIQANAPNPQATNGTGSSTVSASSSFSQDKRKQSHEVSPDSRAKHTYFAQHYKHSDEQDIVSFMLDVLTVNDIRMLVEAEDEVARSGNFQRIFPSTNKKYLQYFEQPRYYNYLLHAWEVRFKNQKSRAINLLDTFCRKNLHLSYANMDPANIPPENIWNPNSANHRSYSSPRLDSRLLPVVLKPSTSGLSPYNNSVSPVISPGRINSGFKRDAHSAQRCAAEVTLRQLGALDISTKTPTTSMSRSQGLKD